MADDKSEPVSEGITLVDLSPSFSFGFEAGQMWAVMCGKPQGIGTEAHPCRLSLANLELYQRMCDAQGYDMSVTPGAMEGLINVIFEQKPPEPVKPRLSLVK